MTVKKGGSHDFGRDFSRMMVNAPMQGDIWGIIFLVIFAIGLLLLTMNLTNYFCRRDDVKIGQKVSAWITPKSVITTNINGRETTRVEYYGSKYFKATVIGLPSWLTSYIVEIDETSQANIEKVYTVNGCEIKLDA
jgi:hypothetical protein